MIFLLSLLFLKKGVSFDVGFTNIKCKKMKVDEEQIFIELNKNKLAIKGIEVSFESLEDNLKAVKNKNKAVVVRIDKKLNMKEL